MKCSEYQTALLATSGGEPAVEGEHDRHHETCPACRTFRQRLRAAEDLLATPAASDKARNPPSGFSSRVVAALPERPGSLEWASLRLLPVTTALALTLLAWCWLATPSPGELWMQAGEEEILAWVSSDGD